MYAQVVPPLSGAPARRVQLMPVDVGVSVHIGATNQQRQHPLGPSGQLPKLSLPSSGNVGRVGVRTWGRTGVKARGVGGRDEGNGGMAWYIVESTRGGIGAGARASEAADGVV